MVIEKITALQKGLEGSPAWVVGEQLKEICQDPACAELVGKDLEAQGMGLKDCAARIKAYADKHRTGNFAFVSPATAEGIIREFYGLPGKEEKPEKAENAKRSAEILNLEDFL